MEVYILDSLYRRTEVVDKFESLIWTERWDDIGDFELHIPSSSSAKALFQPDVNLATNDSVRVMTVETVEDALDDEGRKMFKVKGRSIEKITEDRLLVDTYAGFSLLPYFTVNNEFPAMAMRRMFDAIFTVGTIHPNDVLPMYVTNETLFPQDNIAEPNTSVYQTIDADSLYAALRSYSQIYDLGWRLYRNYDNQQLFFNVYPGSNRTVRQAALPAVVFSPEMENLHNTTEFATTEKSKNVAYVFADVRNSPDPADDGFRFLNVYAPGTDASVSGADRRTTLVKAGSLDAAVIGNVTDEMNRAGLDALAKARAFRAFDGEVVQYTGYKYGSDYYLGDLVTMQNADGYMNDMRVTEQILVSDVNGDRSYPTLSLRQFYTPGTWQNAGYRSWADAETTEYWNTAP
jgi:hypothetical protein